MLDGDLEAITQVCIEKAKGGDLVACKLILDKILPNVKDRPITLKLPLVTGVADIPAALGAALKAVALGKITPAEGQALATMIEAFRKGMELTNFEARLAALEAALKEDEF